jgi:pimeloyl-ACP methyl ester carboxylesterase
MRRGRLQDMDADLRVQQGGSGDPVLLLLHGLGATGDVWDGWRPLLARRWPGRWLAPDLPGHGGSRQRDSGRIRAEGKSEPAVSGT